MEIQKDNSAENKMGDIHEVFENEFWADSSDDEGIGSDESDQYSNIGTVPSNKNETQSKEVEN